MADDPKAARGPRLNPFEKAERTTREATSITGADLDLARKKTARLKAERLTKEAANRQTEIDKKSRAKKPKGMPKHES
jgi:hypothetical protein